MTEILTTDKVSKSFGGLIAVSNVDISIQEGSIVGLIGPNGAGKTTLFNLICGFYHASSGEIYFRGEKVTSLSQDTIVKRGICRTFQNLRIFKNLTVLDNVLIGTHCRGKGGWVDAALRLPKTKKEEKRLVERSLYLLDLLGLVDHREEKANSLPYGSQRRVEIARALASEPDLLLLDEPSAGMNPVEASELSEFILWIKNELKKTILIIEHNMKVVMPIADFITVLNQGKVICEGIPSIVQNSEEVIEAYLGKKYLEGRKR